MAESPTLLFRDTQTGRVYTGQAGAPGAVRTLIDDEGHPVEVPDALTHGDFARYGLFGVDLPVGVELVRREDDGSETIFALERYDEGEPAPDEARAPWRAVFVSSGNPSLVLTEDELLEGLQENPPVYRFG